MSHKDKDIVEEEDIIQEMEDELEEIINESGDINEEKLEEAEHPHVDTGEKRDRTKELLAKVTADFDNFKKRTQRDRDDMICFLKSDILKKILPRVDDMERILTNTPQNMRENAVYEGVFSMHKKLIGDLKSMGVTAFDSLGKEVDPDYHDVMSAVPGKESGVIFDEFEKGYMLGDKVLRHAKVIVGA